MEKKTLIKKYIGSWEQRCYKGGIPDEAPNELERRGIVPTYRFICMALMKNENNLESLGIKRTKSLIYSDIKRNEIEKRETKNKQLKLF